jgi:hypothetical protein
MFNVIGFFRSSFHAMAYGRLYKYLFTILDEYKLPCVQFDSLDDLSKIETQTLIIIPWDLFTHGGGVPKMPLVKYMLLVFEPLKNIEEWMKIRTKEFIDENFVSFINFVPSLDKWFADTFQKPIFFFKQGYAPNEECGRVLTADMEIDVILPGHCYGPDRPKITEELRKEGLVVYDAMIGGAELDKLYNRSKVCAYYPYSSEYTAFHSQRTLWAINKGICCVGVESEDKESETLYKDLYVACSRENLVTTILDIVRSDKWRQLGQDCYERYKKDFHGASMFNSSLIEYFQSILKK